LQVINNVQILKNSKIQKFKNSKIQKFKNSKIQTFKNSKFHKFTNSQIHKFTNSQIHKFTNSQIHKFTNSQIHKFTNSQIQIQMSNLQKAKEQQSRKIENPRKASSPYFSQYIGPGRKKAGKTRKTSYSKFTRFLPSNGPQKKHTYAIYDLPMHNTRRLHNSAVRLIVTVRIPEIKVKFKYERK
jgi:hypothetical protein